MKEKEMTIPGLDFCPSCKGTLRYKEIKGESGAFMWCRPCNWLFATTRRGFEGLNGCDHGDVWYRNDDGSRTCSICGQRRNRRDEIIELGK